MISYFSSIFQSGGGKGKLVRSLAVCEESSPRLETENDNQVSKIVTVRCMVNFPHLHDYMEYLGFKDISWLWEAKIPLHESALRFSFYKLSGF